MVEWQRFPVPEFKHEEFKDMEYEALALITAEDAAAMIGKLKGGDASVCGGHAIMPDDALFDRFSIKGDHRHAVLCLFPDKPVTLLGRTMAWFNQYALVLDSLDASSANILHEWRSPRPMNTRLGPEDGVPMSGGACYAIAGHLFADHYIGNRSIIQNDWDPGDGKAGFRILGNTDDELDDFHDTNLAFTWPA